MTTPNDNTSYLENLLNEKCKNKNNNKKLIRYNALYLL